MRDVTFRVLGEDPLDTAAPLFANFLAVSHVGGEVQFEFIYLDINQLALQFGQPGTDDRPEVEKPTGPVEMQGKTVAKVVVPVSSFMQLDRHLHEMFKKFAEVRDGKKPEETAKERGYAGD